mmetsp:Transcript_3097/g.4693  ORF Transcript_3097/g.4693 Transcript_3097/m.4693 type:complete len:503 (+) Transcript_3097:76-1584(+)|eukprot:CAMPEP_0194245364 /NCGR_PEP_ID=MMETSP0158-20130606/13072_1 /TAXON_ID=33649 /ORGANISM="Thalassionema nitzschioides, Strain L26-B" /LENGTH=502 /DNA_ID=CAMNT_0038981055 /DNA_START=27 /DNA_END=1535 /DNA_ORIENTATION=+
MSTIPADPSMVLGQIVSMEKLKFLQELGKELQPQVNARDKFDAMMMASHNLEGLHLELTNMNVDKGALDKMRGEIDKMKKDLVASALELATITIECQKKVADMKATASQSVIGVQPESPLDMSTLEVKGAAVSSDSMNFDIQFFRSESQTDDSSSESTAKAVSAFVQGKTEGKEGAAMAAKAMKATEDQHSTHKVEGTLVIVCNCTHKIANFVDGTIDGSKALAAWNQLFPDNYLNTDGATLMKAAMETGNGGDANAIHLLTGTTFGSSFVGLAHVLEYEETKSGSSNSQGGGGGGDMEKMAEKVAETVQQEMFMSELTGNFGLSSDAATSVRNLFSKSNISAHCTIICQGAVPGISSKEHVTFVKQMEPSTLKTFEKLNALNAEQDAMAKEAAGSNAKRGQQFISMDAEFLKSAANTFKDDKKTTVKYFDLESMMETFENYLRIVRGEGAGDNAVGGGVPINFYIRKLDKQAVAKAYLAKNYPNGLMGSSAAGAASRVTSS